MPRSGSGSSPPDSRPTRDLDPTELSRLIGHARPSYANLELADPDLLRDLAEGTPPPTPLSAFDSPTERLPAKMFPLFGVAEPRSQDTIELPLGDLSLDEAEVQPLEQVRAQRAFLRIDTHDDTKAEITSPVLVPTKKSPRASTQGTSMRSARRIPWIACGIAVIAAAAVTALLFH